MRSLSFSEYEMISHPLLLLIVVSTSDVDPVGAMQELSSSHHVPAVFTTGQYDPDIHRYRPHVPSLFERLYNSNTACLTGYIFYSMTLTWPWTSTR